MHGRSTSGCRTSPPRLTTNAQASPLWLVAQAEPVARHVSLKRYPGGLCCRCEAGGPSRCGEHCTSKRPGRLSRPPTYSRPSVPGLKRRAVAAPLPGRRLPERRAWAWLERPLRVEPQPGAGHIGGGKHRTQRARKPHCVGRAVLQVRRTTNRARGARHRRSAREGPRPLALATSLAVLGTWWVPPAAMGDEVRAHAARRPHCQY